MVVTNTYDELGEIVRKDYSDGAPSVEYYGGRNPLGEPITLIDATGTRSFEYDPTGKLLAVHWSDGTLAGLGITNRYDQVYGRDGWGWTGWPRRWSRITGSTPGPGG